MFTKTITPAQVEKLMKSVRSPVDSRQTDVGDRGPPATPPKGEKRELLIPTTTELPKRTRSKMNNENGEDERSSSNKRSRPSIQNISFLDDLENAAAKEEDGVDVGGAENSKSFSETSPPTSPMAKRKSSSASRSRSESRSRRSSAAETDIIISLSNEELMNGSQDTKTRAKHKRAIHSRLEQSLARGPSSISRASIDEAASEKASSLPQKSLGTMTRGSSNSLLSQPNMRESQRFLAAPVANASQTAEAKTSVLRVSFYQSSV